jgi:hypothetical protein
MLRLKIERRPGSGKLGWEEVKEGIAGGLLIPLGLWF